MNDYSPVYRRCGCTDPTTGRRRYGDTCPRLADDPDHGSWYFSIRIGGQRVRRGGFRTAQATEQARQELVGQTPEPAPDAGLTVGAWLDTWVASLPKRVRPSTATAYTAHVVNVLRPALGHHRLGALIRAHVQAVFDELASHRNRYHVKITAATVQRVRATLRRALNAAAAHGYLTDNPARMLELPSPRRTRPVTWSQPRVAAWLRDGTRPKIAVWTPQQLAEFLTKVADDLYALWWLAGLRGLRRGELVGLRWIDVDLADATLTVTQTLVELPGVVAESEPKTAAGNRTITLDPATVEILADHRRRQQRVYDEHATIAGEAGFVFAWPNGRPIRPGWLTHRFTFLVTDHGLPPVRLHDLRHGTAMNALHGSASLHTVQHLLGHSSHAFTADVYGTVPDALARAEARSTAATILAAMRQTRPVDVLQHRAEVRRARLRQAPLAGVTVKPRAELRKRSA
ncbi:tyrosine-type recombinase/integrase [Actinoplanes subtropicus]|uniref:tyrosine-type recombinase/integrase n=1 Tax=Actinoplanes subtropicus TaxID=543632 RepID=UPI0004C3EAE4|nr:site-specific integrase [Actinoplanes subtropicus]